MEQFSFFSTLQSISAVSISGVSQYGLVDKSHCASSRALNIFIAVVSLNKHRARGATLFTFMMTRQLPGLNDTKSSK